MYFYIAGKYANRAVCARLAAALESRGHNAMSTWLTGTHEGPWTASKQAEWAAEDLAEVQACDALVLLQWPLHNPEPSTGRHVEFGFALAHGKRIMLIGQQTSVFHFLPRVEHYDNLADFLNVFAPGATWE